MNRLRNLFNKLAQETELKKQIKSMVKVKKMKTVWLIAGVLFLSGCATFSPSEEVFKEKANINSRTYDASVSACFDTLKQVILKKKLFPCL